MRGFDGMAEEITALIGIRAEVLQLRRLAGQIFDPEISRRLYALADDIERGAEEMHRKYGAGGW